MPRIVISSQTPFPVERSVVEEDTYRVLSAPNIALEHRVSTGELLHAMQEAESFEPGDVVRSGQYLIAIIYDLEAELLSSESIVRLALTRVLEICAEEDVRSIAMDSFGHRAPQISNSWFLDLVKKLSVHHATLEKIWIRLDRDQ